LPPSVDDLFKLGDILRLKVSQFVHHCVGLLIPDAKVHNLLHTEDLAFPILWNRQHLHNVVHYPTQAGLPTVNPQRHESVNNIATLVAIHSLKQDLRKLDYVRFCGR
jgi:hypothetical protein